MTPSLHPSEIRLPAAETSVARKVLLGLAGVGVAASFAAGTFFLARLPEEPAPKVTFTRIEDWPEIKNGVPELAPRKTAQASPVASAAPPAQESAPPAPVKAEPVAPPAEPALAAAASEPEAVTGLELRGAPAADQDDRIADRRPLPASEPSPAPSAPPAPPEPPQLSARAATIAKAVPEDAVTVAAAAVAISTAAPQAVVDATSPSMAPAAAGKTQVRPGAPQAKVAGARPKPPARSAKAKPRTERVASAPAPEAPPAAAATPPAVPAAEDDRVNVLGLSLPNLLPSGRKIREAIGSLGL